MTRRATPQPGVDRIVSTSWSRKRQSSPAARQGRALARGLEGRFPLQHHYVRDQTSSSSNCRAYLSLALKHGIYRDRPHGIWLNEGPCQMVVVRATEGALSMEKSITNLNSVT